MKKKDVRKIGRAVLMKLPVFLFCVIYMLLHEKIFGADNTIVGIVFLIALFMTLQGDMEFYLI